MKHDPIHSVFFQTSTLYYDISNTTYTSQEVVTTNPLALLLNKCRLDKHKNRIDTSIIRECHTSIRVHTGGGKELQIVILAQQELAEHGSSLCESLHLRSSHLIVFLQFRTKVFAKPSEKILQILLSHGNLLEIESNNLVNDVVHDFCRGIVNVGSSATEFITASDINGSSIFVDLLRFDLEESGHLLASVVLDGL